MDQAFQDENVEPNEIPSAELIGRQAKRFKVAQDMSYQGSPVTEAALGDRATRLMQMSLERTVNAGEQHNLPILNAFVAAIDAACQPGGAIRNMLQEACEPGGMIGSLFSRQQQKLQDARDINSQIASSAGRIEGLVSRNGNIPLNFPETLGDFWNMTPLECTALLNAYELPTQGNLQAKKERLAFFMRLKRPVN